MEKINDPYEVAIRYVSAYGFYEMNVMQEKGRSFLLKLQLKNGQAWQFAFTEEQASTILHFLAAADRMIPPAIKP